MAARSLIKQFSEEMTCPICLDYFKDAVILDCGHSFCRACLTQCWAETDKAPSCPHCREVFPQKNFRPNWQLVNLVELVKKIQAGKGAEGKRGGCKRHQEPLKLFCYDDQAAICVVCDRSKEHQNHRVLPMEEAFLENKKEIQAELQSLEQERRELRKQKMVDEQRRRIFLVQLQAAKKKTKSAFQQLHNYLEKNKQLWLTQLEKIEKKMAKMEKENASRFSEELSHLNHLITEMEGKCQLTENDFLQDPKTMLSRYVKKPERQLVEPPLELEEALGIYSQKASTLEEQALPKCQESLEWTLDEVFYKVNVTLDLKTAHPQLIVSPDMKTLRWEGSRQIVPDNPERFDTLMSVLGREKFTSGRHLWEVQVEGKGGRWAVGVARESVRRKGKITLNPDGGFWIVQIESCKGWSSRKMSALTSSQSVTLSASIPQKIQVSLDYEEGSVEFFAADTKQRLFAFPSASFAGEALRPYLFLHSNASFIHCS